MTINRSQASLFARMAMGAITREFPNKPEHYLVSAADVKGPRALHPAFFGALDWHSSVHGHWTLVRLLEWFPDLPEQKEIRTILGAHLTAKNLKAEADYFTQPGRQTFERMYGWAWLLKLAQELHGWEDPDGRQWSKNLQPLADTIVAEYLGFLPKQRYPIRTGLHSNTAFGMLFALDYARAVGHKPLEKLLDERSRFYFGGDTDIPARWEPGGADFLSPSLVEADLMRRRAAAGRVPRLAPPLSAGPGSRRAQDALHAGGSDRPRRSAVGPPRRSESEPRLVPARHRRRAAGRRRGASRWPKPPLCTPPPRSSTSRRATTWASTGWPPSPSICSRIPGRRVDHHPPHVGRRTKVRPTIDPGHRRRP